MTLSKPESPVQNRWSRLAVIFKQSNQQKTKEESTSQIIVYPPGFYIKQALRY